MSVIRETCDLGRGFAERLRTFAAERAPQPSSNEEKLREAKSHEFKLAEKCPMCEKPVGEAPNVLTVEETTAIVSAAHQEDHDLTDLATGLKKIAHEVAEGVCRVTGSAPDGMTHTLVPSFEREETP